MPADTIEGVDESVTQVAECTPGGAQQAVKEASKEEKPRKKRKKKDM